LLVGKLRVEPFTGDFTNLRANHPVRFAGPWKEGDMRIRRDRLQAHYLDWVNTEENENWSSTEKYWFRSRVLATIVIGGILGENWFEANLGVKNADRPFYFRTDPENEDTHPRINMRIIELGEMILNLQAVGGFDERIEDLRTATRIVETKIGELMGGRFFKQLGIDFCYRSPVGQKQADYDIDYVRTDGKLGRCEVKCKEQDGQLSANTIGNTLTKAKKQLPTGESGIILLRIPEEWIPWRTGLVNLEEVAKSVKTWFESCKTTRVSSVVVFDSRTDVEDGRVLNDCYYQEFKNKWCNDVSGLPEMPPENQPCVVASRNWSKLPELLSDFHRNDRVMPRT
jgi:hypothetical protein